MKKIFSLCLVFLILALAFTACGQRLAPETEPKKENARKTAPAETAETAEPETTEQKAPLTDEKEKAKKALLAMDPKEWEEELYLPAAELWSVYDSGNYLWEIDQFVTYETEEGYQYYLIKDENMTRLADVKALFEKHFSRRVTEKRMSPEIIVEHDGRLWFLMTGKGGNIYYVGPTEFELKEKGDALVLTLTSRYIIDTYLMAIDDYDNIPAEYLEERSVDLTLLYENGAWVFDTFCMPDQVGWIEKLM